jgi:threonine/homoserine/homoserine lactone efflux protein
MLLGLASRRYREYLPAFLGEYGGDTLWALMVYLLVSTLCARHPIVLRTALSLILAFSVELSQLYHAPWIDQIRQTTLGGLVLGAGFLWTDLICYSIGIGIGVSVERLWRRSADAGHFRTKQTRG